MYAKANGRSGRDANSPVAVRQLLQEKSPGMPGL